MRRDQLTVVRCRIGAQGACLVRRFSYQLLQGYDFVHMARHHGVRVQVRLVS